MTRSSALACLTLLLAFSNALGQRTLDYPLVIERPGVVSLGERVKFSCRISESLSPIASPCQWMLPDGRTLTGDLTTGAVLDGEGNPVEGWAATVDPDARTCGLTIESFLLESTDDWSCKITHVDGPFHMGTFHLLTGDHVRDVRLPRHVHPDNYELQLIPMIEVNDFTTSGSMQLHFTFAKTEEDETLYSKVFLHSKETQIDESSVVVSNVMAPIDVIGHQYDLEREFYVIHLAQVMSPAELEKSYTVSMEFTSVLNDKLAGFYRSEYLDVDGTTTKYLAVTQFEATDARRAFPCLDEPDMKATFNVKLGHKDTMTAESNMQIVSTDPIEGMDGYVMDTYAQSDIMSTYLLAFLVAEFSSTVSPNDATFHIWHIPSKAPQAALAADVGPRVLSFYETFFGIDFPLPKMDMAAIPDFAAGAMENWGLVTYRESTLLFDENFSSLADKETVVLVIAHELAHQWFGNLVTMKWWTDIWLNEGFATYVECIGTEQILPKNRYLERALLFDLQSIFLNDALETALPLSMDVDNPDYDMTISRAAYSKGDSLIRMMEKFLTTATFNKGLNKYLVDRDHANAERIDLWNAMDAAADKDQTLPSHLDVATIMETWTTQAGYPVVTVVGQFNPPDELGEHTFILQQKRFLLNPAAEIPATRWFIPLNVEYPGETFDITTPSAWIEETDQVIFNVTSMPYILNVQETGYYRVNYNIENWDLLTDIIVQDPEMIHLKNRAQILDDSLNLARAGQLDYTIALDISMAMYRERDYIPLEAGLNGLKYLDLMFRKSADYATLTGYLTQLLGPNYDEVGFDVDAADEYPIILKRISLVNSMCLYGNQDCIQKAKDQFAAWMTAPESNPIHNDLKTSVYKVAIREGGQTEFDFLLSQLPLVKVDADVEKVIYGLSHSRDEVSLLRLLDETFAEESVIRSQDARSVYRAVGSTVVGRRVQFDWLKTSFDAILTYFGGPGMVSEVIAGFADDANTQEEIDEIDEFVAAHEASLGSAILAIRQRVEGAKVNMHWMEANFEAVKAWLEMATFPGEGTTDPSMTTTTTATTTATMQTTTTSGAAAGSLSAAVCVGVVVALATLL